ncbi:prepilin-type N-terminal cleavage/methylation domain-containing protein [bacterium]|nr:prepilin-type N-terminal cleavage/methylation domain-containing protein [bacterium]
MDRSKPSLLHSNEGFTLLETMIAVSIMLVAFAAIMMVQSSSITTTIKGKNANIVGMLVEKTMIETEQLVEGKTFEEIKTEDSGEYAAPYQEYKWTRKIKEVEFPSLELPASPDGGETEGINKITRLITTFLSKAIREITVTISWKRADKEQSFAITTYWVNLNHELSPAEQQ